METKKKSIDNSKQKEPGRVKVSEPLVLYGNHSSLILDETKRYTYADYLTWLDDKRRELINGFIRMMSPAANVRHARVSDNLGYALNSFIRKRKGKCQVYYAPFDVRLPGKTGETTNNSIYTVVQPDICLICDLSKLDERGCIGAPDLVIEIQSPSTARYDQTEKFDVYESAGVPEYWIVYPKDEAVTVFLLQPDGKYDRGTTYEYDSKVPVQALKGLEIGLKELFNECKNTPYS